jgi:hypothetical protein
MKPTVTLLAALLLVGGAEASEVFRSTDDKGQPVYTDKPATLPAEKLSVKTRATDTAEVQRRYDEEMKRYAAADEAAGKATQKSAEAQRALSLSSEDRAKRCTEARQRYEAYQNAHRLYEPGATEGERRYLTDAEIDTARANAKKVMDEFCSGQ